MHISLDGFVAGPNGEMNWIKVDQEIFSHVGQRIEKTDAALYGRKTFEMMENYWPNAGKKPNASQHDIEHSQWYNGVQKIVLSKTLQAENFSNTTILNDQLAESIAQIKSNPGSEDILIFGSPTATHALMQLGLVDGYWLFVNPVVLGHGIPLFKDIKAPIQLKLIGNKIFSNGVSELNYIVEK